MNKIRLTESQLKQIISESVKKALNERNRSEKGMSDDEVRSKRNQNFIDDMDTPRNTYERNSSEPRYSDKLEMDWPYKGDEATELKVEKDRRRKHAMTQNHKGLDEIVSKSVKKALKEMAGEECPPEIRQKAEEIYSTLTTNDFDTDVIDWVDPPYGAELSMVAIVKDDEGGEWRFDGSAAATNAGGGDFDIDEIEEMEFVSPEGYHGYIDNP